MTKKELHNIAPTLSKMVTKETGFRVPENYFDSIEDGVLAEINATEFNISSSNSNFKTPTNYFDSLEDLVITKLKAQTFKPEKNYAIPENYFNNLEDTVIAKLKSKSKIFTLKKTIKYIVPLAIAASFLLVFILNNNVNTHSFESLTSLEIEEFIENGSIDFDAESLAFVFPDVELDDNNFVSSVSDSDVLDYLNESEIEELFFEN